MKNLYALFFTFLSLILLLSCEKDKDNPTPSSIPLVKTIQYNEDGTTGILTFTYDNQNRLIKKDFGTGSYTTLEYPNSTKVVLKVYTNNKLDYTNTYTLNSDGNAISLIQTGIYTGTYSFEYSNGFLINGIAIEVKNGNTTKDIYSSFTYSYEYYLDKTNTIGAKNQGLTFWGVDDKNLVSKWSSDFGTSGTYTYEFDNKGRVTKQVYIKSNSLWIYTYAYYE